MNHPTVTHSYEVVADFPEILKPLKRLAGNYWWTWHHETRDLFRALDRAEWDRSEHNPVKMLFQLSRERAEKMMNDELFLARMRHCEKELDEYLTEKTWFDKAFPSCPKDCTIAYFCAEFGISEGLPIYSGGLGILAGDHLKAASDLGVPLVGVGLLYARGYFRQRLNHDGWQQEYYPHYDYFDFPLELQRDADDQPIKIEVEFPDRVVTCHIWKAMVGRVSLYLLDSNVLSNQQRDQGITDTLYGGDEEMRIRQEMILGIGGMRALRAVGITPQVCHMNEGHAAFLSIERIRQYMADNGADMRVARQAVVAGNVFTTHTPVPAGFDLFTPELLERYMGKSINAVGLSFENFLRLGRIDPENSVEKFNMAVLALENANSVNGVSKLHAKVTRSMFAERWRDYPEDEVPIEPITNGIHTLTWTSRRIATLLDEHLGANWRRDPANPDLWGKIDQIPDEDLWSIIENERGDLVRFVRKRLQTDLEHRYAMKPDFNLIGTILDPRVLTIGFARRFATYKRATLMLTDRERLKKILYHPERPVQIIIAGKAHPRDDGGKALIQELVRYISSDGARARMVFLENYDMEVGRKLVQGVDVWLNNPRRPMEASGTSGMKVCPNGGLNCSVLDGWWDEGYDPSLGFAIGDAHDVGDLGHQDWLDSRSLYGLIEQEIAPKFYHRVDNGIPKAWLSMVRQSIKTLVPQFSTARMVKDYTSRFYVNAFEQHQKLSENGQHGAKEAISWRDRVRKNWGGVQIGKVTDTGAAKCKAGESFKIRAEVSLGQVKPEDVSVQALTGRIGADRELTDTAIVKMTEAGKEGERWIYETEVACEKAGHRGYALRVVPYHPNVSVVHELPSVAWESANPNS